ncbi:MAG: MFS transporter [Armatimonadota bacterium]|nr:MFS transporter [Armatimonadota bacterium]MDR7427686.1 MFS transporter [Armatimonadota bacterium]MDR7463998.1 MFS transporter [Armatimonadota bacterium]MDR7470287.1 MFS transporter [Armatimonadota bacterium]MDR7475386.1 MFS transporter [Armatimonadota bacterium]
MTEGSPPVVAQVTVPSRRFRSLGGNVLVAGLVSFFTDIASEMIVPVLPLFLTVTLRAPVAAVGLIEGVAESTASVLRVFAGWLSDRAGRRKPLVVVGYALSNLTKPLLAVAGAWPHVLAVRFVDRVGKGVRTAPRDALIADSVAAEHRGLAFGFHRAMDTAGAAVGPLLAFAALALAPEHYRAVFWVAAVPGAAGILTAALFLRDVGRPAAAARPPRLAFTRLGRPFAHFTVAATIFALGNSSDAFLILRARNLGLSPAAIPLVYFAFNMVYALLSTPAGALSDRLGRRRVLVAGYAVFAVVYLGFALVRVPLASWAVPALFLVYGVYYALAEGAQRAFVVDLVPAHLRATALGTFATATGLALLPASIIAGRMWDALGPAAPFFYGGAAATAALLLLLLLRERPLAIRDRPS